VYKTTKFIALFSWVFKQSATRSLTRSVSGAWYDKLYCSI